MTQTLTPPSQSVENVPCLIGGTWSTSTSTRSGDVYNPSSGRVIAKVPMCTSAEVTRAIEVANEALPKWREMPVVTRAQVMFRFRELLVQHADEIARLVTREHGKTLPEARASVTRGIEVVEFACGIPSLIMGQTIQN